MQIFADLLIWNDDHMRSRAEKHHVAVLTGKIVKFKCPNDFLRFSSILVTKFGRSLTPGSNRFVKSSFFFEQRSKVGSDHVELQPARDLFCPQALTLTTGL